MNYIAKQLLYCFIAGFVLITAAGRGVLAAEIGATELEFREQSPDMAAVGTSLDMSYVERFRLRVPEHTGLSGEYAIDPDGTISLPGVGRFQVANLSPEQLEEQLSKNISQLARLDIKVSVEIARYKPYFIVGMIAEPGANEWRPGLNVIQAIALARGIVRSPRPGDDPSSSTVIQQSKTQLHFALALLARLKAERDGTPLIQTTDRINALINSMPPSIQLTLRDSLNRQNAVLEEQRAVLQAQIAGLQRDREGATNELQAAEQQEKAIKTQLELSQTMLNNVEQLKSQDLVSNSRYLTQRSDLLTARVRYAEVSSLLERARARVGSIERQIAALQNERKIALNERIETIQREVAQLEVALLPANVGTGGPEQNSIGIAYNIARTSGSSVKTISASVFTGILPGDVLVVSNGEGEQPAADLIAQPSGERVSSTATDKIQRALQSSTIAQALSFTRPAPRSPVARVD